MKPMFFHPSKVEKEILEEQERKKAIKEMEDFKRSVTRLVERYIKMIDLKIASQDKAIKDNIVETTTAILTQALADGSITLDVSYDEATESLIIGGIIIE